MNDLTTSTGPCQIATFQVGHLLLGLDVQHVQEIKPALDVTPVPLAPASIRGVVNLRGDVVTTVHLADLLGVECPLVENHRILILRWENELVGLLVDRVLDTIQVTDEDARPLPANLAKVHSRLFGRVYAQDSQLVITLNLDELLAALLGSEEDFRRAVDPMSRPQAKAGR